MKKFLKLVVLLSAIAIGRYAYEKVVDLSYFSLKEIEFEEDISLKTDSLLVLSGLEKGKSIYRQNLKFAADMLIKQPEITSCSVERGFISSIKMEVDFASPVLCIISDKLYGLSREGIVLPIDENTPVLPLVSGKKFRKVNCYDKIKDSDITYALDLYDSFMAISPELCIRLSEINFLEEDLMKLYLSPDGTILILNKRSIDDAIKRISVLEKSGLFYGKKIYDLRFGPMVVESVRQKGIL